MNIKNNIKNLKENFRLKYTLAESLHNKYIITLNWDSNDADYIPKTITFDEEDFENNFLLKLILSYVQSGNHNIERNTDVPTLLDYFSENDLASYTPDGIYHSIDDITIKYYAYDGVPYLVELPEFYSFFKNEKESIKILNYLLNN